MNEYKIINAVVTDPAQSIFKDNRNDAAKVVTIECNNSDNCELYKRGECVFQHILLAERCPYGVKKSETGFTKRASKYRSWISEKEAQYNQYGNKIKSYSHVIAEVGDYIFLPYSHVEMNKFIPFKRHANIITNGSLFLDKEHFTLANVVSMLMFRPQAMMGGEITSYQKEVVPLIALHISEKYPDLWWKVCVQYPTAKDILAKSTYVGREAFIYTLRAGLTFIIAKDTWEWDGKELVSRNAYVNNPTGLKCEYKEARIKPTQDAVIKITDNIQVDTTTKFKA